MTKEQDNKNFLKLVLHRLKVDEDFDCIKIFNGTWDRIYFYEDADKPYKKTEDIEMDDNCITFKPIMGENKLCPSYYDYWYLGILLINKRNLDIDVLYNMLVAASANTDIYVCRLKTNTNGIRIRYRHVTCGTKCSHIETMLRALANTCPERCAIKVNTTIEERKEEKKMNDFSLTNIKDAIVRKVTTLDKKTITILGIIVLLLLIATRYQDIKDILLGIKDKVKRSKNFKAMVTDGTNAVNGLKKIIGIKEDEQ